MQTRLGASRCVSVRPGASRRVRRVPMRPTLPWRFGAFSTRPTRFVVTLLRSPFCPRFHSFEEVRSAPIPLHS